MIGVVYDTEALLLLMPIVIYFLPSVGSGISVLIEEDTEIRYIILFIGFQMDF